MATVQPWQDRRSPGSVQPHNLSMTYVTRAPPTTGAGGVARTPPAPHVTQRGQVAWLTSRSRTKSIFAAACPGHVRVAAAGGVSATTRARAKRTEDHTSELQSLRQLVCRPAPG